MRRLCERPGCSLPTAVSYVIDNAGLVVRLDSAPSADPALAGSLCQKHADGLRVPRGWTIDDRRESVPRLFLAPDTKDASAANEQKATKSPATPKQSHTKSSGATEESGLFDATPAPAPITTDGERGAPWMPRLVRRGDEEEETEVDADGAPVRGRLLGRAFGDRTRGV